MPSRSTTDQPQRSDTTCGPNRQSDGGSDGISGGQAASEMSAFTEAHCPSSSPQEVAADVHSAIVHDGSGSTACSSSAPALPAVPDARHAALRSGAAAAALCAFGQPVLGSHQRQLQHDLQLPDSMPAIDPSRGVSPFSSLAARSPWGKEPTGAIPPASHLPRARDPINLSDWI